MPEIVKGLKDVYLDTTEASFIDGQVGKLLYRGYNIHDLAEKSTFEEVIYLLLYGSLPTQQQLADFDAELRASRRIPDGIITVLEVMKDAHPMDALRTGISALAGYDVDEVADNSTEATIRKGIRLTAQGPTIVAAHHRLRQGLEPIAPNPELNHAGNFLYMMFGEVPDDETTGLLDVDFILHAEHGANASAFAARVTASTISDLHSAVVTGVGTLKGPAHGGAAEEVMKMSLEIGNPENAEEYARNHLESGGRIMGFGHRVYRAEDPRARHLRERARVLGEKKGEPRWFRILSHLEQNTMRALPRPGNLRQRGLLRRGYLLPAGHTRRPVHFHLRPGPHTRLDAPVRGTVPGQHTHPPPAGVHRRDGPRVRADRAERVVDISINRAHAKGP